MAEGDNSEGASGPTQQFQPGATITPGEPRDQTSINESGHASSVPADPAPLPQAAGTPVPQAAPQPAEQPEEPAALVPQAVAVPPTGPEGSISWSASEFIAHHKSPTWYLLLALAAIAASAIVWFLTKGIVSVVVIVVGAVFLGVYGAHEPRQLSYRLDESGLTIGGKHYNYAEFRSFAILVEGAFSSIVFMPLKRFMPLTSIYYAPEDEDKIVALLSARLPLEERRSDAVDRLMHRIHF